MEAGDMSNDSVDFDSQAVEQLSPHIPIRFGTGFGSLMPNTPIPTTAASSFLDQLRAAIPTPDSSLDALPQLELHAPQPTTTSGLLEHESKSLFRRSIISDRSQFTEADNATNLFDISAPEAASASSVWIVPDMTTLGKPLPASPVPAHGSPVPDTNTSTLTSSILGGTVVGEGRRRSIAFKAGMLRRDSSTCDELGRFEVDIETTSQAHNSGSRFVELLSNDFISLASQGAEMSIPDASIYTTPRSQSYLLDDGRQTSTTDFGGGVDSSVGQQSLYYSPMWSPQSHGVMTDQSAPFSPAHTAAHETEMTTNSQPSVVSSSIDVRVNSVADLSLGLGLDQACTDSATYPRSPLTAVVSSSYHGSLYPLAQAQLASNDSKLAVVHSLVSNLRDENSFLREQLVEAECKRQEALAFAIAVKNSKLIDRDAAWQAKLARVQCAKAQLRAELALLHQQHATDLDELATEHSTSLDLARDAARDLEIRLQHATAATAAAFAEACNVRKELESKQVEIVEVRSKSCSLCTFS